MPSVVSDLIAQARKDWKKAAEASDAQRKAILLSKEFRALKQWPDALRLQREGAANVTGQPPQPTRPCFVVDRLSQPVRQISNQIKNADFGFDVLPNGQGADVETAQIIKGYLRRVQNQSRCESPVEWAADGAIEAGLGWFRIRTRYVHETWDGDPNDPEAYDQELVLERIPNSLSVYDDPAANKPTRSDALFRFIVEDMDRDAFKARFPKADLKGLEEFQSTGDMSSWVSKDTIRVAEYWRVSFEEKKITTTINGKSVTRTIRAPIVKGSLINAVEELEPFDWVGSRIPSVPVLGEELNVDGKFVLRGIIALGMDAQRMVNFTYSAAIENFALTPRRAPRVVAASIANYKSVWDTRNTVNWAYHPYDQYDENGVEYRAPIDDATEPPIQAAVALMRVSEDAIKASTSTGDASLGNTNPNERSGRALEALQSQSELANSNYPDNVKRAMIYASELMGEVIPKITRPGQIWHIMGMDDEPKSVIVGRPFSVGPDGVPVPAPDDVTPEMAKAKDSLYKFYDPTAGRYSYTVTVGKATATRQQEGSKAIGELIPHLPPEMAAVATPDFVKQLSFPGAQALAEKLEAVLPPNLQPRKDGQPQGIPPQAQQQIDGLSAQLQQAQQAIETDQAKQQASIETAKLREEGETHRLQMKLDAEAQKTQIDSETKLAVAELGAKVDRLALFLEERARLGVQEESAEGRAHEVGMAVMGHGATAEQKAADRAHGASQADADRAHATAEGEATREAAREQAAQAAKAQARTNGGTA